MGEIIGEKRLACQNTHCVCGVDKREDADLHPEAGPARGRNQQDKQPPPPGLSHQPSNAGGLLGHAIHQLFGFYVKMK